MKLIGVDVGGTFTDVVFADTKRNRIATLKVPTTPDGIDSLRVWPRRSGVATVGQ